MQYNADWSNLYPRQLGSTNLLPLQRTKYKVEVQSLSTKVKWFFCYQTSGLPDKRKCNSFALGQYLRHLPHAIYLVPPYTGLHEKPLSCTKRASTGIRTRDHWVGKLSICASTDKRGRRPVPITPQSKVCKLAAKLSQSDAAAAAAAAVCWLAGVKKQAS